MGLGDIGNAFLIVLIFCVIQLVISFNVGLVQVKNNWSEYKCNPGVIPFAGLIGYDPVLTFEECTKETQGDFMKSFLTPIYDTFDTLGDAGNAFTEILESLKLGANSQQGTTFNLVEDLGNRFKMLISGLSNSFITIGNVFGKITSMVTVIYYLIGSSVTLGKALVGDLPGTAFRIFTGRQL